MNLTCLTDHILFQKYKIILNKSLQKHETVTNNPPVEVYVNRIKIKIKKTGYKLEL